LSNGDGISSFSRWHQKIDLVKEADRQVSSLSKDSKGASKKIVSKKNKAGTVTSNDGDGGVCVGFDDGDDSSTEV
jgi:hypothetical protein